MSLVAWWRARCAHEDALHHKVDWHAIAALIRELADEDPDDDEAAGRLRDLLLERSWKLPARTPRHEQRRRRYS